MSSAGGGENITYYGEYTIHTFTSNGTFQVTHAGPTSVELLVVGGGGGRDNRRRRWWGQVQNTDGRAVATQSYTVTVGSGGGAAASSNSCEIAQGPGGNSTFDDLVSIGGGSGTCMVVVVGYPMRAGSSGKEIQVEKFPLHLAVWRNSPGGGGGGAGGAGIDGSFSNGGGEWWKWHELQHIRHCHILWRRWWRAPLTVTLVLEAWVVGPRGRHDDISMDGAPNTGGGGGGGDHINGFGKGGSGVVIVRYKQLTVLREPEQQCGTDYYHNVF